MIEIWKEIPGYEDVYEVSNYGRVKSKDCEINIGRGHTRTLKGRILKPFDNGSGYLLVGLRKDKCRKNFLVHRLVATCFLENPDGKLEVNHIDENKGNNFYHNLEWVTRRENVNYGTAKKRMIESQNSKPVVMITPNGEIRFYSIHEAERKTGTDRKSISKCCKGMMDFANGCKWQYAEV